MRPGIFAMAFAAILGGAVEVATAETSRSQEINECRVGEIGTWGDGRDRPALASPLVFTYNPDGAPPWFSASQVAGMVAKAAEAWSDCGVRGEVAPWTGAAEPGQVLVQWHQRDSLGNFGLANLDRRTLSLGPDAFQMLRDRNPAHDAGETLQMTLSHEMGHFFGLMAHSRRCVDVLSYYHNGRGGKCFKRDPSAPKLVVEYRHTLPTACDIERCRRANGQPPLPGGRLPGR